MRTCAYIIGILLLIVSLFSAGMHPTITQSTIVIFGMVLLISFFEEMEEFNFFGLKGKRDLSKVEKKLEEIDQTQEATKSTQSSSDALSQLRSRSLQLMGVDRGNLLALIFDIERLLRIVAGVFYPSEVFEHTPVRKIIQMLREKEYLTVTGVKQLDVLLEMRNLIVHGRVSSDDSRLNEWVQIAYKLWEEINNDISGSSNLQQTT